jgi:hypothetical protein
MKSLFIFFGILVAVPLFGQTDSSKWALGFNVEVHRSNCSLRADSEYDVLFNELDSLETGLNCLSYGLEANYKIKSGMQLTLGMQLNTMGHRIDTLLSASLYDVRSVYRYLSIPVGLQLEMTKHKVITPLLGVQIAPGKLIQQSWSRRAFDNSAKNTVDTELELNDMQVYASVQAGVRISLHSNYSFKAAAIYRRNLLSLTDGPIERYYQNVGVQVALYRHF